MQLTCYYQNFSKDKIQEQDRCMKNWHSHNFFFAITISHKLINIHVSVHFWKWKIANGCARISTGIIVKTQLILNSTWSIHMYLGWGLWWQSQELPNSCRQAIKCRSTLSHLSAYWPTVQSSVVKMSIKILIECQPTIDWNVHYASIEILIEC